MMHNHPRILVTGSSLFFSARLIHDLARRGARVTAADSLAFSAGKALRSVERRVHLPILRTDPGQYLDCLIAELRKRPYDLLLPTFEEALLLAEYSSDLRPHVRVLLPTFSDMYRLHHKPSLHEFCLSNGLPTPPTATAESLEAAQNIAADFGFPMVLKLPASNNAVGRTYCHNETELTSAFTRLNASQQEKLAEPPFLQKMIHGDLICTLCFCSGGRKLGEVIYRTLRMFPEAGGTSVHRQSILNEDVSRITERLIAASNWSGFLGLDFLVDHDTGVPYLIDANVRANPAVHLGYCAGLDWTQLIFDVINDKVPEVQLARSGVNVQTLLLNLAWLFEGLLPRTGGIARFPQRCWQFLFPDWPVSSGGDLLSTGEFIPIAIMGMQTLNAGIRSLFSDRQSGELMLEHANYAEPTAALLRQQRQTNVLPKMVMPLVARSPVRPTSLVQPRT